MVALLAEGVDRNVLPEDAVTVPLPSPSSRRAWIEIKIGQALSDALDVALLAEGVDRNSQITIEDDAFIEVALLAEGVDRNPCICGL